MAFQSAVGIRLFAERGSAALAPSFPFLLQNGGLPQSRSGAGELPPTATSWQSPREVVGRGSWKSGSLHLLDQLNQRCASFWERAHALPDASQSQRVNFSPARLPLPLCSGGEGSKTTVWQHQGEKGVWVSFPGTSVQGVSSFHVCGNELYFGPVGAEGLSPAPAEPFSLLYGSAEFKPRRHHHSSSLTSCVSRVVTFRPNPSLKPGDLG